MRLILAGILLAALAGREVQAHSTLVPRFAEQAIAGPGIEQSLPLYLHYFPGDGEAILSARLVCDSALVALKAVHSTLGQAHISSSSLVEINYRTRPLGREQVDTLQLSLMAKTGASQLSWHSTIHTSADSADKERMEMTYLEVARPLQLELELQPGKVFAGEQDRKSVV